MSQKFIKSQNKNPESAAYGKYYAQAVYDSKFIETEDLADYIQSQASVKRSDIIAVLTELGEAMKHYFELGQKVHLTGIGIFKVGFSSIGVAKADDCTASTITSRRVLFQPETERIVVGSSEKDGKIIQKYVNAKTLLKDISFEEVHSNFTATSTSNAPAGGGSGSNTNPSNPTNGDGGNTGGGDNNGGDDSGVGQN